MTDYYSGLVLAELGASYNSPVKNHKWIEVLVDCPGIEGLFTYKLPPDLSVEPGDILSVPFGTQVMGGIAIRLVESLPSNLEPNQIKEVEDVIASGFFPSSYWQLLNNVAQYYYTDIITVIRAALPPGLLGKSQRRLRLKLEAIPPQAENLCSISALEVLTILKAQKSGDYSAQYLQRKSRQSYRGIKELLKKGWLESYLEPPKVARPKLQKVVTLIVDNFPSDLSEKQKKVLGILKNRGGELWLNQLIQITSSSSSTIESLSRLGFVVIEQRERLRLSEDEKIVIDQARELNTSQARAHEIIKNLQGYSQVLLHGVTGSGKTEIYLQAIAPILQEGKSALVLVPEIGLTPQLTDRFRARFGRKVNVYHSALADGERYDTWRQMLTGSPQVIIGTRSAIFAPLPHLGLIVLDEEHDSSFKQEQSAPTYHARTVAIWRAKQDLCPLILGSATPSLESWQNLKISPVEDNYYLSLPTRIEDRPLPPVEIVDMRLELQRGNRSIFSTSLQQSFAEIAEQKQQAILFISRRGHSTFVSCRSCGYVIDCPHCDVSLSYHYTHEGATELLRCHYCNHSRVQPRNCPECGSPYLKFFGSGTQRVTQELNKLFPQLRCLRFDSDTTQTKGSHRMLLERFSRGEADILVGTQMLTKGLDIANVTLVGVVAADGLLHQSNYRASERAFQTLTQVAGRAGRGDEVGKVIIQTYSPEHPVMKTVQQHDYQTFIDLELEQRLALNYPPYGKLILLKISGMDEVIVQKTAEVIGDECSEMLQEFCEILGPAPANITRVARRYRWQILLKFVGLESVSLFDVNRLRHLCPQSISFNVDVDPLSID